MPQFNDYNLNLIEPAYNSNLVNLVMDLNFLRRRDLYGSTPPDIFFQLKNIFHWFESVGSSRLEGNRTTITEYIEQKLTKNKSTEERFLEIDNIDKALTFVDEHLKTRSVIDRAFVCELHKIVVEKLTPPPQGEGSNTPGIYRNVNVEIQDSDHRPPDMLHVTSYMEELFNFINKKDEEKYDLLKIAIAHHRFTWIHPFDNGNGRVVRLLTYAMLVKDGFKVDLGGRIINPTAVFCGDRKEYNKMLSIADKGTNKTTEAWCEYVLKGLKREIEKIDKLLDFKYLKREIIIPAINSAQKRAFISKKEAEILIIAANLGQFQSKDIEHIFPNMLPAARSREIRKLRQKNLIVQTWEHKLKYTIGFKNKLILLPVLELLEEKGFLPNGTN